ncbi:uncharacterized protein LOC125240443 [Leguminivora glycinivorella]|uniref:uncharacterized protein LOC125240443 n=1 Tax=Leguminivora glycinivorella TaxID=1035111 RepID=UPI00201030F0|nr:uncharacterized protein LOC125240443 [Leguminivora glycinivorella]
MGINARVPATWACPACKAAKRDNSDNTPIKPSIATDDGDVQQFDVAEELRLLRADFGSVHDQVAGLRREVEELNRLFSSRLGVIEERVKRLEERAEAQPAVTVDSELAATVASLKQELCDRERDLLLGDVEITGIPEQPNEFTSHLVCLVATKLGVGLDERDIVFAERMGARRHQANSVDAPSPLGGAAEGGAAANVRPRPLVVRLARRGPRADMLRAARVRRGADTSDFGLPGAPSRFYVNERLTRQNRTLFYLEFMLQHQLNEECLKLETSCI